MYRRSSLAIVLAALAVAACALPPSTDTPPATGTPPPGNSTVRRSDPPANPHPKQRNVIAWIISLGPGTPRGPQAKDEVNVYHAVQRRDCQPTDGTKVFGVDNELHGDGFDVYVGLVAACMAALHGGGAKAWATAERALASPAPGTVCLDAPVRALLQRLIKAHRAAPSLPFVADTGPGAGAPTTCPHITKIQPGKGKVETLLTIEGQNLARVSEIVVLDDQWQAIGNSATPTPAGRASIQAPLPALDNTMSRDVLIGILDPTAGLIDSWRFSYEA